MEAQIGLVLVVPENCKWAQQTRLLTTIQLPLSSTRNMGSPTLQMKDTCRPNNPWLLDGRAQFTLLETPRKGDEQFNELQGLPHLLWMVLPELCSVGPIQLNAGALQGPLQKQKKLKETSGRETWADRGLAKCLVGPLCHSIGAWSAGSASALLQVPFFT